MKHNSEEIVNQYRQKIRDLSNEGKYEEVFSLAKTLHKKHPHILYFEHLVAVYHAEKTEGFSPKQLDARYKIAAARLKKVLRKMRGQTPNFRNSVRNEYYWFSKQPKKQFLLGVEGVSNGEKNSYYSQGVGSATLAKNYAIKGKIKLCIKWAKISEKSWRNYFKYFPNWSNSYVFFAQALAYQGRMKEMEQALEKCRVIAKRPKNWPEIKHYRKEIMDDVEILNKWKTSQN